MVFYRCAIFSLASSSARESACMYTHGCNARNNKEVESRGFLNARGRERVRLAVLLVGMRAFQTGFWLAGAEIAYKLVK